MNLCVIPARGGSKRIPRKNVREFCGKPMIQYPIDAALESALFDHVVVSTDCEEIAKIAGQLGAEVPFSRPAELSDDHAPTVPVIAHAIEACESLGWKSGNVCCIYPCTPFLKTEDLRHALDVLTSSGANYCFPVTPFPHPIQRAVKRDDLDRLSPFFPEYERVRSQDLEAAYHDAGQFYWGTSSAWAQNRSIFNTGAGIVLPNWRVVDIDTPEDWTRAEILFRALSSYS